MDIKVRGEAASKSTESFYWGRHVHKTLKTKNKEVPRPFLLCFLLFFSFKLMVLGEVGGLGGMDVKH